MPWQHQDLPILIQYSFEKKNKPAQKLSNLVTFNQFLQLSYVQCCNYLSQWLVELELTWLFTNRFRGVCFFLSFLQKLTKSFLIIHSFPFHLVAFLSKNWVVNNLKSTQTQLVIETDNCSKWFPLVTLGPGLISM